MIIDYYVINPTENITILVETPVPMEFQPFVASKLLCLEQSAEQVGFVETNEKYDISVRMAGGEFCGNACISAAALYSLNREQVKSVNVCMSGIPVNVECDNINGQNQYSVIIDNTAKHSNVSFEIDDKAIELQAVSLLGITHIIVDKSKLAFSPEKVIRDICKKLNADALGIMIFDFDTSELTPLVYVPKGDTLYWENSCASGTAAVGAYLCNKCKQEVSLDIKEPGGILNITANNDKLVLTGGAYIVANKKVDITIQ